jgi:hypothetical protein
VELVVDCAAVLAGATGPEFFEQPQQISATASVEMSILIMALI